MAALRTPVTGCPWDLEQNFATIAPYTIEEAYEVVESWPPENSTKAVCDENASLMARALALWNVPANRWKSACFVPLRWDRPAAFGISLGTQERRPAMTPSRDISRLIEIMK